MTSREKKDDEKWVGKKNDASSRATISSMTLVERMSKKIDKEGNKRKADSISVDDDDGDNAFDHVSTLLRKWNDCGRLYVIF